MDMVRHCMFVADCTQLSGLFRKFFLHLLKYKMI